MRQALRETGGGEDHNRGILRQGRPWPLMVVLAAYLGNLALHAVLGGYSRFLADDYCSAGIAHRFGVLRAVWYWYLNWTGRYAASTLDAIFGLLGPAVTPFVAPLVIILWTGVTAGSLFFYPTENPRRGLLTCVVLASALIVATLELSPNVAQSLYWGQGMRSIVSPLILSAVYVDLLLWYSRRSSSSTQMKLLLACSPLLAFIMGGLNETFTALELSALIFSLLLVRAAGSPKAWSSISRFLVAGIFGAAAALLAVVGAPGNLFRQVYYPPPPSLPGIVGMALTNFGAYLGWLAVSPERWLGVVGAAAVAGYVGLRRPAKHVPFWQGPLTLAIGLGFSYLCFLPAAYGLSDKPPDRTLMIPAFILVFTIMLTTFTTGRRISQGQDGKVRTRWETALLALALLTAVPSSAWSSLRLLARQPAFATYAAHWDTTNAQILSARAAGENEVWIQSIPNWAGLDEPNDNRKYWVNLCYEEYYGIRVLAEGQP